jgi:NAD(P)-dependent dehydrogenase (short-subunit alcohol dehydrogenase family)
VTRVLVTGGSRGIGLAVATDLAEHGVELLLVARDADTLTAAAESLPGSGHVTHAFDVSDEAAWQSVQVDELNGLVCAAGVMDPIGATGSYAVSTFRRTLDINVVGTLLAVQHCLPALRATGGSIVTFGGGGATGPLPNFDAYAASKAAVARLTENLAIELAPLRVNCIAPGFVVTRLHDATLAAGPEAAGPEFFERTRQTVEEGGFPASDAAELVRLLVLDPEFTGKLVSAQWDPWRDPVYRKRLATDPDLGTVRRIDGVLYGRLEDV